MDAPAIANSSQSIRTTSSKHLAVLTVGGPCRSPQYQDLSLAKAMADRIINNLQQYFQSLIWYNSYGEKTHPGRSHEQELIFLRTLMINQAREVCCQGAKLSGETFAVSAQPFWIQCDRWILE
jgi:hypothetical protein